MIDLHCHILPSIDDGPDTMEGSLKFARVAAKEGIRICLATPHYYPGLYTPNKFAVLQKTARLNRALQARRIKLRVLPGMEVALTPEAISCYQNHELLGLSATRYMLVEASRLSTPETIHSACYQLLLKGATPVLAHPERNLLLREDVDILFRLVRSGVLLQVNAKSLDGSHSQRTYDFVHFLMQHKAVHCIASDGHSATHRLPRLREAVKEAYRILNSKEEAQALVTRMPERIILGKRFSSPPSVQPDLYEPSCKRFVPFIH